MTDVKYTRFVNRELTLQYPYLLVFVIEKRVTDVIVISN